MSSSGKTDRRAERGRATREQLVAIATRLFTERGYEGTSIELVLQEADVSRGALYHHFHGKDALFEAVLEAVEADIARVVAEAGRAATDPLEALRAGCAAWLRLARTPAVQRIALIDAPAVVGWEKWRAIDERHAFGLLKAALQNAQRDRLPADSVDVVAHMLLAALAEVAILIARAEDPEAATKAARTAVDELLERLLGA